MARIKKAVKDDPGQEADRIKPEVWFPYSHGRNPLDYYVRNVLGGQDQCHLHDQCQRSGDSKTPEIYCPLVTKVARASRAFRGRVEAVIAGDGGFNEK